MRAVEPMSTNRDPRRAAAERTAESTPILRVPRRKPLTARVGLMGVGHHTYWNQFPGLRDELVQKMSHLRTKLAQHQVDVVEFGLVDCAATAANVLPKLLAADLDLLFVDMVTYATSATIAPIFRSFPGPIVLVALQPMRAMDYPRATTRMQLFNDDICSVPEFTGVAIRLGRRPPPVLIGIRDGDPEAERELAEWCSIAHVLHDLRRARIGLMGHVLEAMLDMHVDPTAVTAALGCHVTLCEPDDLRVHYLRVDEAAVQAKSRQILEFFDTPDPGADPITMRLTPRDLEVAARAAVALERFVEDRQLDGLAYYYEGAPDSTTRELMSNLIVGNSLLTAAGFPMCGEYDLKTCCAMLILDRLGIGGSFAEFHPMDFERGTILVGHDGPHHLNIADRKPVLRSLRKYHGKPGAGASVEFSIRTGSITILSIGITDRGRLKFVIAEGESLRWPIPATGNTNTHGRFAPDLRTFLRQWVAEGPTHHFALGIGHHARSLMHLAELLNIEHAVVTPCTA